MSNATPVVRRGKTGWFPHLTLLALGLTGLVVLNIAGCPKPQFNEAISGVTLQDLIDIRNNTTLDTAGKTQALNNLGITDPQLIQVLLTAPLPKPVTSTTGAAG